MPPRFAVWFATACHTASVQRGHPRYKLVVVGHSLGGYLAVAYAERFPERVERIVLLSPVGIPQRQLPRDPQRAVEGGREAPYQAPVGSNREKPLVISMT